MLKLGLIVNPLAGVGGRLALKGSDDRGLVDAALARGAARPAPMDDPARWAMTWRAWRGKHG
jgi:predicted polyphosphate/ATP-dependent NAD kinase